MDSIREKVARSLCEHHIRNVRRHDTSLPELAKMLPGSVDYSWTDFIPETNIAIATLLAELDTPSESMVMDARVAWLESASDYKMLDASMTAAIQAIAAHIRAQGKPDTFDKWTDGLG